MIDKIYIEEAVRIRKEYLNNLIYISNEEDNIKEYISKLKKIQNEIENGELNDEKYYREMLFDIEIMIKKATNKIKPYYDKIKVLDNNQSTLYNNIREKYTNITDDEIKNDILPYIVKIDKILKKKFGRLI